MPELSLRNPKAILTDWDDTLAMSYEHFSLEFIEFACTYDLPIPSTELIEYS